MSRQDKCGVRTASQLERKYNFGDMSNNTANPRLEEMTKQINQTLSQFITNTNARFEELEGVATSGTHFYSGVPTLLTEPASNWNTDKDKEEHIGDIYYDISSGQVYLFKKNDNVYEWAKCINSLSEEEMNKLQLMIEELNNSVDYKIANLVGTAPDTLDTLEEVAQAIKDNENVVDALNSAIGTKASQSELQSLQNTVSTNGTALSNHISNKENPHGVTKIQVGLENVDNTSDANKPVSTAQQTAINNVLSSTKEYTDGKVATLNNTIGTKANQSDLIDVQSALNNKAEKTHSHDEYISIYGGTMSGELRFANSRNYKVDENGNAMFAGVSVDGNSVITTANYTDYCTSKDHATNKNNPHGVSASQIGLGNVNNTSDANKPVSTAQQTAINNALASAKEYTDSKTSNIASNDKIEELTSHTTDKNNPHGVTKSQVGLGNVPNVATNDQTPTYTTTNVVEELTSGEKLSVAFKKIATAVKGLIEVMLAVNNHTTNTSNPHSVTKSQIGLGNVDNTSDANKPISTATQNALNGKANTHSHPYLSTSGGTVSGSLTVTGNTVSKGTTNWLGKHCFNNEWIGMYNTANGGTRKGWIGHDGSTNLAITNEAGGAINFSCSSVMSANMGINFANAKYVRGKVSGGTAYDICGVSSGNTCCLGNADIGTVIRGSYVKLGSASGSTVTSDKNLKTDIKDIDEKYVEFFKNLKPKTYKYKLGNSSRPHFGFIAQEVEQALLDSGLTNNDFAGICIDDVVYIEENEHDEHDDMNWAYKQGLKKIYALRYEEFISLNTQMIQNIMDENELLKDIVQVKSKRIDVLEEKSKEQDEIIANQQKEINNLKEQIQQLKELVAKLVS